MSTWELLVTAAHDADSEASVFALHAGKEIFEAAKASSVFSLDLPVGDVLVEGRWSQQVGDLIHEQDASSGMYRAWSGAIRDDGAGKGRANFVLGPSNDLYCNIRVGPRAFKCQPCKSAEGAPPAPPTCVAVTEVPAGPLDRAPHVPVPVPVSLPVNDVKEGSREAPAGGGTRKLQSARNAEVDVLLPYTRRVRDTLGGEGAVRALLASSLADTNMAFANSGVVGWRKVDYAETGDAGQSLTALADPSDGTMDFVHGLRDRRVDSGRYPTRIHVYVHCGMGVSLVGADLVQLITADGDLAPEPVCGTGFVANPVGGASGETAAFSVAMYQCLFDNYSMAHEMGHNFGLTHNRADSSPSDVSLPYAFGYQSPQCGDWHTVMAYPCGSSPSDERIPYFSSPRHFNPDTGEALGVEGYVDAARALTENMGVITQYRQRQWRRRHLRGSKK
ncbi:hypothetical protein JKP88DRAFT_279584 [Tribonema minus]|uniref:Uncharacterized protein n=1 Tax=Tribonema minus TaxID=303371 RepID=A0A835YVW8_9STRA|nr:hypothetical protein JKP88DRAFT_279584 [Tribonema minus]